MVLDYYEGNGIPRVLIKRIKVGGRGDCTCRDWSAAIARRGSLWKGLEKKVIDFALEPPRGTALPTS